LLADNKPIIFRPRPGYSFGNTISSLWGLKLTDDDSWSRTGSAGAPAGFCNNGSLDHPSA
jgi:hypothetical protein